MKTTYVIRLGLVDTTDNVLRTQELAMLTFFALVIQMIILTMRKILVTEMIWSTSSRHLQSCSSCQSCPSQQACSCLQPWCQSWTCSCSTKFNFLRDCLEILVVPMPTKLDNPSHANEHASWPCICPQALMIPVVSKPMSLDNPDHTNKQAVLMLTSLDDRSHANELGQSLLLGKTF